MIKGLSQIRRLPRVGIIRLGIKAKSAKGTEYPKAVDYFVCPDEVQKVYGERPKELDIVFPLDNIEDIFPQFYKMYGHSTGLKCKGDGELANRINAKGEFEEVECLGSECPHYQDKECKEVATLNFILPKIKLDGIYQLNTSSFHSIVKINSSLDYIRSMFGKISMIPLKLIVEGTEAHPDKKMKKIVYTLRIAFDASEIMKSIQKREGLLGQAMLSKAIEAPKKIAPKVGLPSSDENPIEEPPIEEGDISDADNCGQEGGIEIPEKKNKPHGLINVDEDEVEMCDICERVLTDKEIEYCEKNKFKDKKGNSAYKNLCLKCRKDLGY